MKLALLSDIHANRQALDACLAHAEAAGAERHAFLGDLVGYGADPSYVVQRVMAFAAQGAIFIQGNHDLYATQAVGDGKSLGHASVAWTQQQLSEAERAFLAALPLTAIDGSALLVHASADAPASWRYVENPQLAALSLDAASQPPPPPSAPPRCPPSLPTGWSWVSEIAGAEHRHRRFQAGRDAPQGRHGADL